MRPSNESTPPADQSWENRLAVVGRILDEELRYSRDLCLVETEGGFITTRLVLTSTDRHGAWSLTTTEIPNTRIEAMIPPPEPTKERKR